jgi:hypothetical protein
MLVDPLSLSRNSCPWNLCRDHDGTKLGLCARSDVTMGLWKSFSEIASEKVEGRPSKAAHHWVMLIGADFTVYPRSKSMSCYNDN